MRLFLGSSLIVLMSIAGCTVGPNFTAPTPETPKGWVSKPPMEGQPESKITSESADTTSWWSRFNDPELTSLIERARDSNPDLQQAALRIEEARAQLQAVGARNLPTVGLDSSYGRTRLSPNGALGIFGGASAGPQTAAQAGAMGIPTSAAPINVPPFDLFQSGFDASWEIDLFGRVRRSIESTEAQGQALVEARNDALVSVFAEVARSYIQLRGVQRLIAITQSNLKAQQDAYNLTHAQAQGGETSNLDVESASAEVATTAAQLPALEDQEARVINALMPSDLARRRPDIRHAEAELHAATANIGVATADLYPRLTMTGSIGLQALRFNKLGDWASKFYNFGPSLQIPVFNGVTYANISVQEVRQKEAALTYKTTVLSALHDVENAVSSYQAEQVRLHALQRSALANEHSLSLAQQRYRAGLSSFLDVLDAERRLYASQTEVARSSVTISTNLIAIYKALGGGWTETGGVPDAAAQPMAQPVAAK